MSAKLTAQEKYTLEDCYRIAYTNYPLIKSKELNWKLNQTKIENLKVLYLPSVSIDARATYQSDVMTIGVEFPSLPAAAQPKFPEPPFHNVYADLNIQQTIWDGGYSKLQKKIEEIDVKSEIQNIEIETSKIKEQILEAFFLVQILEQQAQIIQLSVQSLKEQEKTVESAVLNGISTETSLIQMKAEILKLEQKLIEIEAGSQTAYLLLYETMNVEESEKKPIELLEIHYTPNDTFTRLENELFKVQKEKLNAYSEITMVSKSPKIGAFAKFGYGNPGLNYFSGGWDTYYIVGLNFSWKFWDWNETKRKQQIFSIQSQLIDNKEETFNKNIQTLIKKQESELEKLEKIISTDQELIKMNKSIVENYNSQLKNESITTSEYLTQWNKMLISELNKKLHEIELEKIKANLQLIMNN
jgi:outer membrane protein TolC